MANHSPQNSGTDPIAALNSPKRVAAWTQIVRGVPESESTVSSSASSLSSSSTPAAAAPSSPSTERQFSNSSCDVPLIESIVELWSSGDDSAAEAQMDFDNSVGTSNAAKKPAWNKPSNGAMEVGPVMGAASWPPLSESTKATPKSSSSELLKVPSDGSVSASQEIGIASSSSSHKQVSTSNVNPSSSADRVAPVRQKSMKRGSGTSSGSVSANGDFQQQPSPQGPLVEMPSPTSGKPRPASSESSSRDHIHRESGQRGGYVSQPHTGNDHHPQRNSFRRGNGGHNHNHRGNQDWNSQRSFSGRDNHMQPQRMIPPRNFMRGGPPHGPPPFIPPPLRPYTPTMVYPEMAPPLFYVQGPSVVTPIPSSPMYYPVLDPQLNNKILNQIDYYFSNENIIKDTYLRQKMDEQGWVPIKLIAGFKKVKLLTENIQLILDVMRSSNIVEVQGDKVRRRNDWNKWLMPPTVQFPTVSSPRSLGTSGQDTLASNIQRMSLEENANKQGEAETSFGRLSSTQSFGGEGTSHTTAQAGSS
ncbi:hypothetical protein NMG60_11026335 [Bertholletia excelsa]